MRAIVGFLYPLVFTIALIYSVCSLPTQPDVSGESEPDLASTIGPELLCQLGCLDVDSFPDADGLFINYSTMPETCFDTEWGYDSDEDGLVDYCEVRMAEWFRPQLRYNSNDNVSGEPRWAAKPVGNGNQVEILYLTSMYDDFGYEAWYCDALILNLLTDFLDLCSGHFGDAEALRLVIDYEPSTYHWLLVGANFSQHTGYGNYDYQDIEYSWEYRGAPNAWVSWAKHALYATQLECGSGTDSCVSSGDSMRLRAYPADNLGSSARALMDCVPSYHPVYSLYNTQECYWTRTDVSDDYPNGSFGGWQGAYPKAGKHSIPWSTSGGNAHRLISEWGF